MALHKDRRRVDKDHLVLAVRKDFNAAGVAEQEVETSFMYSIHNQSMYNSGSLLHVGYYIFIELTGCSRQKFQNEIRALQIEMKSLAESASSSGSHTLCKTMSFERGITGRSQRLVREWTLY